MKEKLKVILTQGVPASGKTTWAKEFVKNNEGWVRLNRDDLRCMLHGSWNPSTEPIVTAAQFNGMGRAIEDGFNVILDDTNLSPKTIESIKGFLDQYDIIPEFKWFEISKDEALRRDALREAPVGAKVINGFFKTYINNKPGDEIRYELSQDLSKQPCIVVDLDGTLALRRNRGYYHWNKVDQDWVYNPTFALVTACNTMGMSVIILTGRDESCRKKTTMWLKENDVPFEKLFMRPNKTQGPTKLWKKKIMEEEILPNYYVHFVVEDRKGEVETFREMGIGCFQAWDAE